MSMLHPRDCPEPVLYRRPEGISSHFCGFALVVTSADYAAKVSTLLDFWLSEACPLTRIEERSTAGREV
jgi:hypothetical protein